MSSLRFRVSYVRRDLPYGCVVTPPALVWVWEKEARDCQVRRVSFTIKQFANGGVAACSSRCLGSSQDDALLACVRYVLMSDKSLAKGDSLVCFLWPFKSFAA